MAKLTTEDFLSAYKELESELREGNISVLDYETTLPPDDSDRLKIARQIRNYIQHHLDGSSFIAISSDMYSFVLRITEEVRAKRERAKDRLKRIKAIKDTDKLEDACLWMSKNKKDYAPVVDKDGTFLGTLTASALIAALTKLSLKKKIKDIGKLTQSCTIASPNDSLKDFSVGEEIIVVDNKKYKGIVKW